MKPQNFFSLVAPIDKYKLDTETEGSKGLRDLMVLGCSVPSLARALLRARGSLNPVNEYWK